MASKASTKSSGFRCSECGWTTVKWVGRCGECQAWGTRQPRSAPSPCAPPRRPRSSGPALPIGQVDARRAEARSTGVGEFDRVLGGGLVPGAVVLVAGEPGIGKSTLLLDVAARAARPARAARSSTSPARSRRPRSACAPSASRRWPRTPVPRGRDRPRDRARPGRRRPARPRRRRLGADDRQRARSRASAGNVSQVREVAASLIQVAKARGIAVAARRPRHQGRLDRRAAGPRAPRRRRRAVRGRPALAAAAGARGEEPLRPDRRGRLLRPVRRGHRRAAPTPAGCSSRGARSASPAPASP